MSFDLLAPHYRWMEWFLAGGKLQRCRTAHLPLIENGLNILLMGEGNGRFLLHCRRRFPGAWITCVDASARMLSAAQQRLLGHGLGSQHVRFVQADALAWSPPSEAFDIIATHFFLDCFRPEQLHQLIESLAQAARPKAFWLVADFHVPARGMARLRAQAIHWLMYRFFRWVTLLPATQLTPPDGYLRAAGFELRKREFSEWGLLRSDLWQSLALKN